MTVALAGRAPATFEIKSANLPLVSLLVKSTDLAAMAEELKARFGEVPEFFDNDPMVLDLSPLGGQGEVDFGELLHLLRGYRVQPVAVRGGSAEQMEQGVLKGLAVANELRVVAAAQKPLDPGLRRDDKPLGALVVDKPLRSGQQVYARGRDLVVMQMVNPGAEVIADGHIHVYAPLRGKAMAGAKGNTDARIFSLAMEAQLISIAGIYRTSEVPLPAEVLGHPAQVRLEGGADGKLVIEAINQGT
ncbi:septum site-determining protein MinC [Ramlibacter sp. PS4R-6]|uniref:septum site-determining protein MinC n=1 Tax=Ramlibacter sp. PS4R-6 TaxID=3133438 RepID=UPI0030B5462B